MKAITLAKICAVIVCVGLVIALVVGWVGRESDPTPANASQSSASTPTPTTTAEPSVSPTPSPESSESVAFTNRVLAFEQAYRELDPALRREALRPYVTEAFLNQLIPPDFEESDYLKSLREGAASSLDLSTAAVYAEDLDENTLEVFTQITKVDTSDGNTTTMTLNHTTYWVRDASGLWRVDKEDIT